MTNEEIALNAFKASKWSEAIAAARQTDLSNAEVLAWMGYCYRYGYGVSRDFVQAFTWFKKSAEGGYAYSMGELGHCYYYGRGTAQNYTSALAWYRKGADRGNAASQTGMGHLYEFGQGVEKNSVQAFQWYKRAAENGDVEGTEELGECYEYGFGVGKDFVEAFKWYLKAADKGNAKAQCKVAGMYENGNGTGKDLDKAFQWYMKSAEKGNSEAQNSVGVFLDNGRGVEKDPAKALYWFKKAAAQDNACAQCNVGLMYEFGRGTSVDLAEAVKWYRKSAENGWARGMYRLGLFYENGKGGVAKDLSAASKWYKKAADDGNEDAKKALEKLKENDSHLRSDDEDNTIRIRRPANYPEPPSDPLAELDAMIGLQPVKTEVKRMVKFIQMQKARAAGGFAASSVSYHCVFTGNPGTGKTTVARIIARILKQLGVIKTDKLVETDRSGLVAKYIGQTAVKTNEIINSALDGVLFIDEAYALAKGGENDYGKEAVDTLLKRMEDDRDRLVVIIAGYTEPMQQFLQMNPGLKSRFTRYIDFPDYDGKELTQIFKSLAKDEQYTLSAGVEAAVLERMEDAVQYKDQNFGNGRYARNFYQETLIRKANRFDPSNTAGLQEIIVADLPELPVRPKDGPGDDGEVEEPVRIEDVLEELDALTGLKPVKDEVKKLVGMIAVQKQRAASGLKTATASNHLVFIGSPGTGKTTVARLISKVFKALGILKTDKLIETDKAGLCGRYIGETAIKTNKVVDSALDGVLFIDEAYTLAEGGEEDYGKEAVDTLLKRMEDDRSRLVVIVAGYTKEMKKFLKMNPGLQSRFTRYVDFPDYSADELTTIFKAIAEKSQYTLEKDVLPAVRQRMDYELSKRLETFANARFVRTYFEQTLEKQASRVGMMDSPSEADLQKLTVADLPGASVLDGDGESIEDILKELDELVGIKPVKQEIRKLVNYFRLQNQRKAAGLPVAPASYHCVFSGSPGTGKTTVARYMARAYKALGVTKTANLVEADRSKLVAEFIGQTAVKTNAIIDEAMNGVLFIDEAYTLANGGEKDFGHEAVDTLLKRMEDDRDRLVVIIAGYTDEMHRFIDMNPGLQSRFTRYINFPDYNADELAEIFARMAKKEKYRFGEEVMCLVQDEMNSRVANKSKSFGNARVARTFYEQAKERQAMRLASVARPTTEQLTELLPEDISDNVSRDDGTNPYDVIGEASELEAAKGLLAPIMVNNRSIVKHCAYKVAELLADDLLRDKGLAGQYPMMIRADISASLHIGIGAATEYRLHPAELNSETVYNMMMRGGGLCTVGEIGVGKLGAFATEDVRARLSAFDLAFQSLGIDVAKRDRQYYEPKKMAKEQVGGFWRLLHREAYAGFLTGFAIGAYLQQEGTQEVVKNGISVQIDYTSHLNLALAQNSRPLISNLRIKNTTRGKLKQCECRISCPEKFLLDYSHGIGDIWEGKEIDSGAIPIRFNVETLRRVASVQTGYLRVEILSEGRNLFTHDYRIEAVAPDHSHDIIRQPDMIAAYVIPHCGVVRQLQSDAATLLGQGTRNPSLDGYQGDRERVAFICRAIFEAIKRKYIRYAESPADFGLPGQKIRLPNEIMKYKLATCLDSTLLFASLAEACNLHPVVVLILGHAFVGVFLEDKHLPKVSVDQPDILKKFCHDNALLMIETTAVCHSTPFDTAVEQGMKKLFTLDDDDFEWAIDVSLARLNGVRQLALGDDDESTQGHGERPHFGFNPDNVLPTPPVEPPESRTPPQRPPLKLSSDPVQPSLFDVPKKAPSAQPETPAAPSKLVVQQPATSSDAGLTEARLSAMKKPSKLMFDGVKVANVSTWKDVFQKLLEKLNELDPTKFDSLAGDPQFGRYFMHLEQGNRTPRDFFKIKLGSDGNVRAKEQANKVYLCRQDYYFRKLLTRLGVDVARIDVI